jgi:predicted RNA-binding Zn ribbon-like protein
VNAVSQPAGRARAPGDLRLVQDFVNTVDLEDGPDLFATRDSMRSWLFGHGLLGRTQPISAGDFERILQLREAVRGLALANNAHALDPAAITILNRESALATGRFRFRTDGATSLEPSVTGIDRAVFAILSAIHRSMANGSWERLKACRRHSCRWVFFDQSRNRSGTWCAMAICGNKEKTGAYYRRTRSSGTRGKAAARAAPRRRKARD